MKESSAAGDATAAQGAVLTVDLDAVAANYRLIAAEAAGAEVAAVVKADAYGLGAGPVARALAKKGCGRFFVAEAAEGAALRRALAEVRPDAAIYVLNGLYPGAAAACLAGGLVPCLASLAEVAEWREAAAGAGRTLDAVLHFDTGMNRLGMSASDAAALATDGALAEGLNVTTIMSHLACSDDAAHPQNAVQLERFRALLVVLAKRFPGAKASLANSGGIFLGRDYHFDMVRPGVSLYGGNPFSDRANPFRAAVTAQARVVALRDLEDGAGVGYGATWRASGPARIAILAAGYADGYHRAMSAPSPAGSGAGAQKKGGQAWIAGYTAPVAGRISMDMLAVDVSGIPAGLVRRGDMAELIGPHITVDDVGLRAGTLGYEVLTALGRRYMRLYISGGKSVDGGRV